MPPPDPRSRTVSPGLRFASAVGLPHPREASTASEGISLVWLCSYRFEVIGSEQASSADPDPQHEAPLPVVTLRAACPYFSLTTSLMLSALICPSF
jgi:hypothetical protein